MRHRHQPGHRVEAVVHAVDRAVRGGRGHGRPGRRRHRPEPRPPCPPCSAPCTTRPARRWPRWAELSAQIGHHDSDHQHGRASPRRSRPRAASVLDHQAEHHDRGHRQHDDRERLDSRLLQGVGFSKGWAELGPKKPPPLVPSCLMATSGGDRAACDRLRLHLGCGAVQRRGLTRPRRRSSARPWPPAGPRRPPRPGRRRKRGPASCRGRSRPDACRRAGPRITASMTARPPAGVTNCSQTMPPSWLKYERCCSPE